MKHTNIFLALQMVEGIAMSELKAALEAHDNYYAFFDWEDAEQISQWQRGDFDISKLPLVHGVDILTARHGDFCVTAVSSFQGAFSLTGFPLSGNPEDDSIITVKSPLDIANITEMIPPTEEISDVTGTYTINQKP